MNWIADHLAPMMFVGMILFMLIGYPAAFSLAATGLFFGFLGIEFGLIRPDFLGNLTYQLFGIISNDLLLAIPFFTFMGAILERCGLAEDMLDSMGQLFGTIKGGQHLKYPEHTTLANLHMTLLERAGIAENAVGDSTGKLAEV